MKIKLYICLIFIFVNCSAITELSQQQTIKGPEFSPYVGLKTSIAVMDFKNYTDQGEAKFGSAVSDMLVSLLVKSGRFIVLERQRIQEILQEQAVGQSGAITEETAPEVGKLLGVKSLIIGDILEISQKTESHKFGNKEEDDKWSFALKAAVGQVKFHYRLVNTTTGEIIFADDVSASEIRPGFGIKTKEFDFEDMFELDQTILGIATRKAVNNMVKHIVNYANEIEWEGKVVQVKQDSVIYFTPGRRSGVKVGDTFTILGKSTESIDDMLEPEVELKPEDESEPVELIKKCTVEVIDFIGDKVAKAIIVKGESVERGDRLKPVKITPE